MKGAWYWKWSTKTARKSSSRWNKKNKKERRWTRSIKQKQSYYRVEGVSRVDMELTECLEYRETSWKTWSHHKLIVFIIKVVVKLEWPKNNLLVWKISKKNMTILDPKEDQLMAWHFQISIRRVLLNYPSQAQVLISQTLQFKDTKW